MFYVGVDVGGMSIKLGIVNENGDIIFRDKLVTSKNDSQEVHAIQIGEKVNELILNSKIDKCLIKGVGIGAPGGVKPQEGIAEFIPNIPWVGLELSKIVSGVLYF